LFGFRNTTGLVLDKLVDAEYSESHPDFVLVFRNPMHASPIKTGKSSRARVIVLLVYVFLVVAEVLLTDWEELFGKEECDAVSLTTRMWYQRLVTSGYRKPRPHVTRLVTLSSPSGHDFTPCERRLYLAQLINRLRDYEPAIIVLDYAFRPRNDCTQGETRLPGTPLKVSGSRRS
jgi:hypothetical protein